MVPSLGNDHLALAGEEVSDRTGVGERAVVAGQRGADLHGGAVAVVGEALDQHGHAVGSVALVHDGFVLRATGLQARATLDGAVDVVVGDRRLLRLLDRVKQRGVSGGVSTTRAGRDFDVLDRLGKQPCRAWHR
ncbi:hypothetical protein GCM10025876_00640 [Demequina litorisediminis]|uniref:Uncharacterized protein n=1 Tax=Demequina litorisediminis TaxID=1849022 RepID=A0ABQ6I7Z5_9MICO|nr:hypothetical protein GCM10025876_00640 [Demequina litorisediminis]